MGTVLIACDKFKGSLTALQVGQALARGISAVRPDLVCDLMPVADGGDGTLDAALAAGFDEIPVMATGPTGETVSTRFARRGTTAVVELADACGLGRLPGGRPAPLTASTRGVGDVLGAALDAGCRRIVLGIGGSASTDGGAGMVAALGARLLDSAGRPLPSGGAALLDLAAVDLAGLHPALPDTEVLIACDVDNPLLGPTGAAAVYGPQKGADPDAVALLDRALSVWADAVSRRTSEDLRALPGAGAAGGVGFAGAALLGARLVPGIDVVLDLIGFADRLSSASLVITGEGSLDEQTLHGKAPVGVARAARASGVPVVAVCGRCRLTENQWRAAGFDAVHPLSALEPDLATSMARAAELLQLIGRSLAATAPHAAIAPDR